MSEAPNSQTLLLSVSKIGASSFGVLACRGLELWASGA